MLTSLKVIPVPQKHHSDDTTLSEDYPKTSSTEKVDGLRLRKKFSKLIHEKTQASGIKKKTDKSKLRKFRGTLIGEHSLGKKRISFILEDLLHIFERKLAYMKEKKEVHQSPPTWSRVGARATMSSA